MAEDGFDRQINDSFHGTGKRRTALSGMFLVMVDRLFGQYGYHAVTGWEDGDTIVVCVEKPDDTGFWQSMGGISITEVQADIDTAAQEFVQDYIDQDLNPPPYLWLSDHVDHYVSVVQMQHPGTIEVMQDLYGKRWELAVAEVGAWLITGVVKPHWLYIQSIERVNGSLIIVHKEQRRRWRLGDPVTAATRDTPPGQSRLQ